MTDSDTLNCPTCHVPVQIDAAAGTARCPQCNAVRKVEPISDEMAPKTRRALGMPPFIVPLFFGGLAVFAVSFPVLHWYEDRVKPANSIPKVAVVPAALTWDVTRPPIFHDLDGDGIADLIGRYRPDEGGEATIRVGAFNAKTLKPLWTTRSLGSWVDGLSTVQVALAGQMVLLSDAHGGLQLRTASSGAKVDQYALTSPVVQLCAAPNGEVKFWAQTQAGKGEMIDPSVSQPTPTARPSWCPEGPTQSVSRAHVLPPSSAPAVSGFSSKLVINEGTDAVAVGLQGDLPTLVGFDPSRPGVRWSRPVSLDAQGIRKVAPMGSDLVNGVVYVPYQIDHGRRLLAADAATGKSRWDIAIPGAGPGTATWERIMPGLSRVYVPGPKGLTVYDAHTGREAGTLGG